MSTANEILVSKMTLEEKISLLAGVDLWHTASVPRLDIPPIKVSDGPVGARGAGGGSGPTSACFPAGVALAATWNVDLVQQVGGALAEETKAKGAHILLAPTVNIHHSPLAGRNFECYSEDPYLAGCMAIAYINGLQGHGVGACIKHFVCNDSEFERNSISSEVNERALREIYLKPFQMAVGTARPWAVMSAYNKVNGVSCSENPRLLLEILKGEWGFDGVVMSDWFGTYSQGVALGGLDLEMPGPGRWLTTWLIDAIQKGEIDQAIIDDKVLRILRLIERSGAFQEPDLKSEQAIDKPEHRQLARQVASESVVLLKNEGPILPIDPGKVKSIAMIGVNARWAQVLGGGSAEVTPHYIVSPLEGIRQRAGNNLEVSYAQGCQIHRLLPALEMAWFLPGKGGLRGLSIELYDNLELSGVPAGHGFTDRAKITWYEGNLKNVNPDRFSARLSGKFITPESGQYRFGITGNGMYRLKVNRQLLVDQWKPLEPDQKPWGHGEVKGTIELKADDINFFELEYAWEGQIPWRQVHLGCLLVETGDLMQQAVELARASDVAVVVAGLAPEWESEGFDRRDMELPGDQATLIEKVAAVNPNTIVIINAGSSVRMPWLGQVPAVLQAWYLGQETGNALADVLFGDVNPSGKLPTTLPKRLEDNPAYINYPGENGRVYYGEGIFVGYRYYDAKDIEPLFPFGYGLSYTTFEYSNLRFDKQSYGLGETVLVSLDVTNTGKRAGKEIVQVYVRDPESSLRRPVKELKGFVKISLTPGEIRTVTMTLDEQALSFYNDARKVWVVEAGAFEVMVGSSSRDIRLRGIFEWKETLQISTTAKVAYLSTSSPLRALFAKEGAKAILIKHLGTMLDHPQLEMALDYSLKQIATFVPDVLTTSVLATIDEELKNSGL